MPREGLGLRLEVPLVPALFSAYVGAPSSVHHEKSRELSTILLGPIDGTDPVFLETEVDLGEGKLTCKPKNIPCT